MPEAVEKEPGEELMSPERWNRLETVFDAALAVRHGEREQFLNQACEGDLGLRREVESLLSADNVSNDLLQNGAAELCLRVMADTLKDDPGHQQPSQDGIHPGLVLKNRWEILAAMDEGGMGQVYKARDLTLDRLAVVKVLKKDSQRNPWKVKKFGHEGHAQSQIKHANVAILFDKGGIASGEQFLVMEFIEGKTLRQLMNDHKLNGDPIDSSMIADIMKQTGRGVEAIHQAGLVHRDLKPENIMIQKNGDDLEVKIIDFGIVRVLDKSTVVGQLVGTVFYMAPEQLRGEDATTGSDVYALGVIAYELLTGRRPFEIGNVSSAQAAVRYLLDLQRKGIKLKPSQLRDDLLPETNRSIMKGLSFDAKKRPSARQFTEELARLLNLVPPPRPAPARKWWLAAAGIVLAGVLGLTSWGLLKTFRATPPSDVPNSIVGTTPERKLTYWLTILRKRDGKTIRATTRETFDTGDEFRFHFVPSEAGALYVFNEGASKNWHVLFPTHKNNNGDSRLTALQEFATKENVFTADQTEKGTEGIWIVWASRPIQTLDDIVRQSLHNDLQVSDPAQLAELSRLTKSATAAPEVSEDKAQGQVTIKGRSDIFVHHLELEHKDWK